MVVLKKRNCSDPHTINPSTGEVIMTMGGFAKLDSLSRISFRRGFEENPLKRAYLGVKEVAMRMLPASYYHKRREERIDSYLERI